VIRGVSQVVSEVERGVEFPQPPIEQPFGWWSKYEDQEGNRFALMAGETGEADRSGAGEIDG